VQAFDGVETTHGKWEKLDQLGTELVVVEFDERVYKLAVDRSGPALTLVCILPFRTPPIHACALDHDDSTLESAFTAEAKKYTYSLELKFAQLKLVPMTAKNTNVIASADSLKSELALRLLEDNSQGWQQTVSENAHIILDFKGEYRTINGVAFTRTENGWPSLINVLCWNN